MPSVTCFGEVLWDIFPTHKKVGGAPLNVALRLQSLGIDTRFISSVGNDKNGDELMPFIVENKLTTDLIQVNNLYPTGCVNVTLDEKGSASYEIQYPVAWDKIECTQEAMSAVKNSDAFIFGSLACRDTVTKNTLEKLLNLARFKIFDVNLRAPFYTMELLLELMQKADFVKMNDEELVEICKALHFDSGTFQEKMQFLATHTQTKHICVTLGKDGALLWYNNSFFMNKGYVVQVADTVGAGDSFLATLIASLLNKMEPEEALDRACAVGSLVASKEGANPAITAEEVERLRKSRA